MSEEIKKLRQEMDVMYRKLEDGKRHVLVLEKGLRAICPHKWKDGFMFSTCEWCGEES